MSKNIKKLDILGIWCYTVIDFKGNEEEFRITNVPQRNGGWCKPSGSVFAIVASEPRGRNRKGVELLRDGCVNA
jgi:hypothetical protein